MNKKGALLEKEVINMVISVIGIAILVLLAFKLYGIFIDDPELIFAEENLNEIMDIADGLENGQSASVLILNLKNWYLKGFTKNDISCNSVSCLCFCEGDPNCGGKSECTDFDYDIFVNEVYNEHINGFLSALVAGFSGGHTIDPVFQEHQSLKILEIPEEIFVAKAEDKVYILKSKDSLEVETVGDLGKIMKDYSGCICGDRCEEYGASIASVVESYKNIDLAFYNEINPLLIVAIMVTESNCEYDLISNNDTGLMQINSGVFCESKYGLPTNLRECQTKLIEDDELNINLAVGILYEKYDEYKNGIRQSQSYLSNYNNLQVDREKCIAKYPKYAGYYGIDAALRGYNGWGCSDKVSGYVEKINKIYNELNALNIDEKQKSS